MEGQSGLSELSGISWVSAIQRCPLSGVPLYHHTCVYDHVHAFFSYRCLWDSCTTSLSYCTKIRVIVVLGRFGNSPWGIYVACTVKCSCAQIFYILFNFVLRFMQTTLNMTRVTSSHHKSFLSSSLVPLRKVGIYFNYYMYTNTVRDDILHNIIWQ